MISKLLWLTIISFIFAAEKKVLKDEFKSKTFFISELIPANPVLKKMQKDFFSFCKKNLEEQIANSFYDDDTFNKMFLEKNSDIWQKSFYEKYKDSIDLIFNEMLKNEDIFDFKKMLSDESKKICTTYLRTIKEKNESQPITDETILSDQRNLESFITNLETMLDNSIFRNKNDLEDIKTFQRDVLKRGLVLYFKILYSIFCLEIKKIKSIKYIKENPSNSEFKREETTICKESLEEILEKLIEIKHLAFLYAKSLYDEPIQRESFDDQDYTRIEKSVGAIDIYGSISLAINAFINKNSGFNLQEYLDNSSYIKEIKNHAIYVDLEKGKLDELFGETLKNVKVEDFLHWFIKNIKTNNIQESSKNLIENHIKVINEFEFEKSVFFSYRQRWSFIQEDYDKTLIYFLKRLKLIKKILIKKIVYLHYDSKFFALQNKSYKRILSYLKNKSQKDRRENQENEKQENENQENENQEKPESKSETCESKIKIIYNHKIIDLLIDTICSISNDNVILGTAPYSLFYSPFTSIILKVKRFNTAEKVIEKVYEIEDLMDFLVFEFLFYMNKQES